MKNNQRPLSAVPAFFWVILSFFMKVEGNLGIQTNSKIIIHHTLLRK